MPAVNNPSNENASDFTCIPNKKGENPKRTFGDSGLGFPNRVRPHFCSFQETERIKFAVTSPPHFLPIWLARDAGIFKKHGIDIEIIYMRGGSLITMGILNGDLQLSGAGAESVVAARVKGGDVNMVACPLGF